MGKVICAYYADKETFVWADDGGIIWPQLICADNRQSGGMQ